MVSVVTLMTGACTYIEVNAKYFHLYESVFFINASLFPDFLKGMGNKHLVSIN